MFLANKESKPMKLSSFCFGLGLGAVLGVLFAPKSGEATRADVSVAIQTNLDEVVRKGRKLVRQAQRKAGRVLKGARELVKDVVQAAEHRLA
jgi:gas vesicle protein